MLSVACGDTARQRSKFFKDSKLKHRQLVYLLLVAVALHFRSPLFVGTNGGIARLHCSSSPMRQASEEHDSEITSEVSIPDGSADTDSFTSQDGVVNLLDEFGTKVQSFHLAPNNYAFVVNASLLLKILYDPDQRLFPDQGGEIQRNLDAEHLMKLKQYQTDFKNDRGFYSFPNPIIIAKYEGKYALLDGQHRLETMRSLQTIDPSPMPVLVSMFVLQSIGEYDDLFVALNKNKPVRLYRDVKGWKEVLKGLELYFTKTYPKYMKKTKNPRPPNMKIEKLMEYMDDNNVTSRIGLGSEDLIKEIEELNECYQLHWKELIEEKGYVPRIAKLMETASNSVANGTSSPLFLGIYKNFEWLKRIELKVRRKIPYMSMNHVPDSFRPKLPKKLKMSVWEKRNGVSKKGQCYICCSELQLADFECGHVESLANCGKTDINNLEPICKECFSEMGMDDMTAYINRRNQETLIG